jgi:hypothetical protein
MVFIHSTLKMEHALLSEGLLNDARANSNLETLCDPSPFASAATATLTCGRILSLNIRPTVFKENHAGSLHSVVNENILCLVDLDSSPANGLNRDWPKWILAYPL